MVVAACCVRWLSHTLASGVVARKGNELLTTKPQSRMWLLLADFKVTYFSLAFFPYLIHNLLLQMKMTKQNKDFSIAMVGAFFLFTTMCIFDAVILFALCFIQSEFKY